MIRRFSIKLLLLSNINEDKIVEKTIHFIFYLSLSFLFLNCLGTVKTSSNKKFDIKDIVIQQKIDIDSLKKQEYKILGATITDSLLVISIENFCDRSQGIQLLFTGFYKKSLPPVIDLYLDVPCADNEKMNKSMNQLIFNISRTKYPGTNEIIIYLKNYEEVLYYKY